jgi:hypothetical protein
MNQLATISASPSSDEADLDEPGVEQQHIRPEHRMNDLVRVIETGSHDDRIKRLQGAADAPALGEWYWVLKNTDYKGDPQPDWLGCAMKVGSNFVEIHSPHSKQGHTYVRIHFDDFVKRLRHEPRADEVIRGRIGHWQGESSRLLTDVERVTRALGMTPQDRIGHAASGAEGTGGALMVLSGQDNPKAYSTALALAKEETLPALFKDIAHANEQLARWMQAPVMPTLAQMKDQRAIVADIDDRIFSVSLYAGLTEEAVQVAEGAPAAIEDKLHVMQRLAFMDEECLTNYKTGGMEFTDLGAFDEWLALPENRDRILPFPRTLVAMRVRRTAKHRDWEGSIGKLKLNFEKEQADKLTFLYVRNGDQLWRISTEIDFGELIFPDPSVFNPSEPKMVRMFARGVKGFMSRREWEHRSEAEQERRRKYKEWADAHEHEPRETRPANPFYRDDHDLSFYDWEPFDPSSVYFDDAAKEIEREIKEYNRVALIIQGLFDRSMCLHPHLPARTWTADGFDRAVKLVEDGTNVLNFGEPPDFEAYRARCNASLGVGSMTVGQDDYWARAEGEKESARRDHDARDKSEYRPERYRPFGNPGPGYIARVARWTRTGKATFEWQRESHTRGNWGQKFACSITVPASELLNVDAYTPGDFKQFFADPRTRREYLRWAPILIAAEEYHAERANQAKAPGA